MSSLRMIHDLVWKDLVPFSMNWMGNLRSGIWEGFYITLELHFIFLKIFLMWTISFLKSLLNLWQCCFCFMFWFFGHEACGILAPQTGIKPAPAALEGEVLTTGPPKKSLELHFLANELTCKVVGSLSWHLDWRIPHLPYVIVISLYILFANK